MKKTLLICLLLLNILANQTIAQQVATPAPKQSKAIVLQNAILHIGNGTVQNNTSIRFENGVIVAIGSNLKSDDATVIDASNKHVYPGFILMSTALGLSEIDAVRASIDHSEVGMNNANSRALIAYNAESDIIPTIRNNGILLAQITPKGYEGIQGTSFVAQLDAWNWEDAALRVDDGLHLNFPSSLTYSGDWTTGFRLVQNGAQPGQIEKLANIFQEAKLYASTTPTIKNLRFEAMKGVFDGSKTLYIAASLAKDIIEAVHFAENLGVKNLVITGADEAWRITDFLKEKKIPLILNKSFVLPQRDDDHYDLPYKNAGILQQAGIRFSFAYSFDTEPHHSRNLPFSAGMAVGYGLPYEAAVQAMTLSAAQILGIDKQYGSLEVGKSATLFISTGDALDMRSNQLTHAFIDGRSIDLRSKHTQLYERFKEKYNQK
ncbi:MAG: amidohydrolase [Cytophagales bacterium]|nr:MAG: amidohydrolase [Cytophagales bacterium]TAF60099.1 MAG: amidohydrolase [Cytophagales bacterium]